MGGASGTAASVDIPETPLQRFKALYEESDPDRIAQSGMDEYMNMYKGLDPTGSMTQSESVPVGTSGIQARLEAVPEEEEEQSGMARSQADVVTGSQSQSGGPASRLKRKADEDGDVQMEEAERPKVKRRAVQGLRAVEETPASQEEAQSQTQTQTQAKPTKPVSKVFDSRTVAEPEQAEKPEKIKKPASKAGAAPGKPDKDEAFLKAVASTKRGKKHEDRFDREFNNLKISKPDLRKEEVEKQWDVLEEFGDDGDVRGNFMVVVEMEIPDKQSRGTRRYGEGRMEWEGRPDFKKFKKVCDLSYYLFHPVTNTDRVL